MSQNADRGLMYRRIGSAVVPFVIAAALAAGTFVSAQQVQQAPMRLAAPPLTQKLGVDPAIATGLLPNGLRYYVRANKTPEHRAELRLVVNVGSVQEEDAQRGYAHIVEHMAFEGTRRFPRETVIGFVQSLGMGFGPHLNAETTFDDTTYILQVPTDRPGVLERSLEILQDWSHDVTFNPAAVERQRRIVTEEWRQGLGAAARVLDQQRPILLKGSRYADRLPIGKMETVQSATANQLKQFYGEWYRPDLMAVIAVGDFDRASVVKLIANDFGGLSNPKPERPLGKYPVPPQPGTRYAIATDPELTNTLVSTYVISPATDGSTVGGYRRQLLDQLFAVMMNARFEDTVRQPGAPFLAAQAARSLFLSGEEASVLTALVPSDGIARGLQALLSEITRVARDGFTAGELDRAKRQFIALIDRVMVEKDNRTSAQFAAEYIRAFTEDEALPSLQDEMAMRRALLDNIPLADVNALAAGWSPDRNRVITVAAPQAANGPVVDAASLAAAVAAAKPLPKYVETSVTVPLVETPPRAGTVTNTATRDPGITEWTLSNGAKVVLKPTPFKEDEVMFRAFAFGGTSLASDDDFIPAETASSVVTLGGLGRLSATDLGRLLTGKTAHANPYFASSFQGLSGGSSRRDLETLMQLIYLRFTAPREDAAAFATVKTQLQTLLANQEARPEVVMAQALSAALTQNHPRARGLTVASLDKMNLARSMSFYKDRFADASGFTFVFVGSLDPAELKPLVEKYIGGLPSTNKRESWRDLGIRPPTTVVESTIQKGVDPKGEVAIVFSGPITADEAHRVQLQALARIVQGRLFSALRQELGGTYGVTATAQVQAVPIPEYSLTITFTCDPARAAELTTRAFNDIASLKVSAPNRGQVNDIVLGLQRDFETNSKQNLMAAVPESHNRTRRFRTPRRRSICPTSIMRLVLSPFRTRRRTTSTCAAT